MSFRIRREAPVRNLLFAGAYTAIRRRSDNLGHHKNVW
jgi:hypothetical protein